MLLASGLFVGCLAAALLGLWLRPSLADQHLDDEARGVVTNITGLMSAMAALLLGLLVASGQDTYNSVSDELDMIAANLVALDRSLRQFGPEAEPARATLYRVWKKEVDLIWPPTGGTNLPAITSVRGATGNGRLAGPAIAERSLEQGEFADQVHRLEAKSDVQKHLLREMLEMMSQNARTRVLISSQATNDLPTPIIIVLTFWLVTLFLTFGLLARSNPVVSMSLVIGAASVAGAFFVVLELSHPFGGLMTANDRSLRAALVAISR